MVKKKISGQTIAIIALTALLLIAVTFGGVYAFYSAKSNQVSGKITMATLDIGMNWENTAEGTCSAIVISNGKQVVPGQTLENSPLVVSNSSQISIYVIVVYELTATRADGTEVVDKKEGQLIDVGTSYVNERCNKYDLIEGEWVDYVFTANPGENEKVYRILVSTVPRAAKEDITVIGLDSFKLSAEMNNDYQGTTISIIFQAYAIGSDTFNTEFTKDTSKPQKCKRIVESIYSNYTTTGFLNYKKEPDKNS